MASALLDAADNDGSGPHDQAGDPLSKRLYQVLSRLLGATVTLGESLHGHPADALVRSTDGTATRAVLLDPGPAEGADAARHLRLTLHRQNLLSGSGEKEEAIRWPAWRLYDTKGS
ncbi:hypothetical protein ADK87_02080 [Streptomyces sp. NRRL F-4711]|uniref:hypothetical protein n=1 Tax=unclassified Streptomyces TaxID=2593676 RepID=UPI0004BF9993|nr:MULTISPECIES: hypothetical protein [unclassified Streptomyces]KOU11250.1 hypothetical protein ADK87_02080 [Streptomyces sp. NRRL F-4711]